MKTTRLLFALCLAVVLSVPAWGKSRYIYYFANISDTSKVITYMTSAWGSTKDTAPDPRMTTIRIIEETADYGIDSTFQAKFLREEKTQNQTTFVIKVFVPQNVFDHIKQLDKKRNMRMLNFF